MCQSLGVSRCFHFKEQQIRHLRHEVGFTVQRLEDKMSAPDSDRPHTIFREDCDQHLSGKVRAGCLFLLAFDSFRSASDFIRQCSQSSQKRMTTQKKICVFARRRRDGKSHQQQHRMRPLQLTASTCCAIPACNEYEDGALKLARKNAKLTSSSLHYTRQCPTASLVTCRNR